ncbi:MAG: aspartate aminotransferase family protein [Flavobacteriales bacterium]|nr:aspartate aminotransferase family protein [Flavobacteriales bacterium]|tara:strand:- start:57 stop:1241 length:1185 start_codon:yes stop_codon:yes gene_type:complete
MVNPKKIFKKHQAQTFPSPSCLAVKSAKGNYIIDIKNKKYLDFVAGVSACSLGHSNPIIINEIKSQIDQYTHVMVYGEYIQEPQYKLAQMLADILPENLNCTYFTNSGTEAIEGAIKLAKRITKNSEIISFKGSYHGSTQGSLSIMGNENQKSNYRPLIPDCKQLVFNNNKSLLEITSKTAAVVVEPIQGATGFIKPKEKFIEKLRKRCDETNTLLIFDEIQTCFGRLGEFFALNYFNVIPDILCIAKGMGGGMPIGAFISSNKNMNFLTDNPPLGHITTFGGHPVNCAASLAVLKYLKNSNIMKKIKIKEAIFRRELVHEKISKINGCGLMLAIVLKNEKHSKILVEEALNKGLILFYFLNAKDSVRVTPPLTINEKEIVKGCLIIKNILDNI